MAMEMRIMRTELLAAAFFFCALLMRLIVAQRGGRWWRPVVVGCAGLLITLAMLNKIQFLFLIGTLPLVLLPFGARQAEPGFWHVPRRAIPAFGGILAVTALAAWLAKDILLTGFFGHGTTSVTMPTLRFGATYYWPALALWIALGMIAFAMLWRVTAVETLAAMSAAVAGCMIGLLALDIRYHPNDVLVVFHPLEYMLAWASASEPQLAGGFAARAGFLVEAVAGVIARRTFVLASSPRPTIFLEWFVVVAAVIAIRRGELQLVLQVGVLMLADWGIDTLSMARRLKQEYFLLTDPLAIIAAALLIAKLTDLQRHRWTYPVGAVLIVAHVLVSQAEPVKHIFSTDGPEVLCGLYGSAKRVEHFAFCLPQ
jgi:hypothetical protein